MTILGIYGLTLDSDGEKKDAFYDFLNEVLWKVPFTDKITLLGDLNSRMGSNFMLGKESWANIEWES